MKVVLEKAKFIDGVSPQLVDSFEGFRSDHVHFSPSLTTLSQGVNAEESSSFHFSPKGFAHFFAWWR